MIAPNEDFAGVPLDSSNEFQVLPAAYDMLTVKEIRIDNPVPDRLTRAQALRLAAWISVIVDPSGAEFRRMVRKIQNPK